MSAKGTSRFGSLRSKLAVGTSAGLAAILVAAYLAAGGASYEPQQVRDPCQPREWRAPDDLQRYAEQFTLSALDGAACELGVSREVLAQALATEETREEFRERYDIDDARFEEAVRAGLVRAIDDAEAAGAISSFAAIPLREIAMRIPVDEAIELIQDARPLLEDAGSFFGGLGGLLGDAESLIPELGPLIPEDVGELIPEDPGSLIP